MVVTDLAWKHHELGRYRAGTLTILDIILHHQLSFPFSISAWLQNVTRCFQLIRQKSGPKSWPLFYGFNILEQARWELSNKLGIEREGLGPTCAGSQLIDKQYWSAGWRWHTAILLYNVRRLDARAGPMLCWLTKSFLSETFLVFWLQHISNEIKLLIMKSTRNEFGIRVISSYTWILS